MLSGSSLTLMSPAFLQSLVSCSLSGKLHVALIPGLNRRIERNGFVPEKSEHLHACVVVPDTGTDDALRTGHATHFGDRLVVIGDKIHDKQR